MGKTHLCENAHLTYKIVQYTCFNCTCYTCLYDKCVWDMSQYNKLSDIQYARFHILPVDLHLDCFGQVVSPPYIHQLNNLVRCFSNFKLTYFTIMSEDTFTTFDVVKLYERTLLHLLDKCAPEKTSCNNNTLQSERYDRWH